MVVSCSVATSKILYPFRLLNLLKSCRPTLKPYAILAGVNYPLTGVPLIVFILLYRKVKEKTKEKKKGKEDPLFCALSQETK